ncbi:hypothetical protein [Methylocystis parvus]|uniref:3',5'-cyclic-nucleotide phosphodiesterase n=1 Tax=Methylocystis parvus TaxID=134 RepID=A0A6B8M9Q3_9HYPH|nr:hypothetical protein [Methylocystis parvus]QGM98319.1 hypothetical protein F7D14_13090 [Methylocystis parvus]WBK01353.1 hypothetical protein MMG94_06485 [Methylocystis parvus OBBP]
MRKSLPLTAVLSALLVGSAFAQGTPEQRRACKDDAYKYCPYDVPNPQKTEACLRKYMQALSAGCRAQFHK